MASFGNLLSTLQSEREKANKATQARLSQAIGLYDRMISQYEEGGSFGQGVEARLDRLKTQTVAGGMQNLVSSRLANTTMTAGLGQKFAEEVAAPTMLSMEDLRTQRLSSALEGKANLLSMVEDTGPSSELISALMAQIGQGSSRTVIYPSDSKYSIFDNFSVNKAPATKWTPPAPTGPTRQVVEPAHWEGEGAGRYWVPDRYGYVSPQKKE